MINLLSSPGTITDTCSNRDSVEDGRVRSEHPWASQQLAQLAEKKLDDFMMKAHDQAALEGIYVFQYVPWLTVYSYIGSQVIIPKASSSKAIVFCDGVKGRCFLSDSFNRMMELQVMGRSFPRLATSFY